MRGLKSLLTASVLALSAAAGQASEHSAADPGIDWSEVTGSIGLQSGPFFQFTPVAPSDGEAITSLQRFGVDSRQLRFEGEMGRRDIPIYLRKEQTADGARLKLRFINSVAVMPEASRLKISINDTPVAEVALDAAGEAGNIDIAVPSGLLGAGYNAVTFAVQQRHRVDCTIEAANELWTQIDASVSGLQVNAISDAIGKFEDLNSLPVAEDGALPITVVLPQGAENVLIDQSFRAAQALAIRISTNLPKIQFARESTQNTGILLYVGTITDLRSRGVEANPLGDQAFHIAGKANGQVRVAISGATAADVNQNIFRMLVERPNKTDVGTPAGLRAKAAQRGTMIEPDTEISLADVGLASEEFSGRVYRASFNIQMPPDFYPADNGKATMFVSAEYVAGLSPTNEALVRINGKVAGATRLARSGGDTLTRRPIEVTMKSLTAGFNTLTLEIRSATEEDKDCNPLDLMQPPKRLSVDSATTFTVPKISRIFHLPNLSATAGTGFPFNETKQPLTLFMPRPDMALLGAAATLVTRVAIASGRPYETRLSSRAPDQNTDSALIVGSIRDLPITTIDYFGLKKDMVPASWQRHFGTQIDPAKTTPAKPAANTPAKAKAAAPGAARDSATADARPGAEATAKAQVPLASSSIFGAPQAAPQPGAAASASLLAPADPLPEAEEEKKDIRVRWGETLDDRSSLDKARQGLSGFLQRNIGYTADQLSFLNGDRSAITATRNTKLILAQQQAMAGGAATWLLLTGPDSGTIQRETTRFVAQTSWGQVQGRMVAFDPSEAELVAWPEGRHYHYDMRDWSFSNVTLVAAGWLSNHIQYYVAVILILCGIFGLFTRKLLNRIGAQP